MLKLYRVASVAALIGLLGAVGDAQQAGQGRPSQDPPPAAQDGNSQRPSFRVGINFVRIDTIVTDRNGQPVTDLTPEDFEVTEAGKPQNIETFKLVSLDGGLTQAVGDSRAIRSDLDEETEAARDDVRLFGIFLDDYHVARENSMATRQQLARFVQTQLGPSDMVALMAPLDPLTAIRHTRSHDAVMRGIQLFEGRKYDYRPRTPAEERLQYSASAETIERVRNEVSLGAIKALILRMGGLKEGRKALILVSEGYSNVLPPQMRDVGVPPPRLGAPRRSGDTRRDDPRRDDPTAGDTPVEVQRQAMGSMDMNNQLREVYDLANRNNTAIYTVDPRGLAVGEFGIERNISMSTDRQYLSATLDTLKILAENSDGRAIVNTNDLLPAMKQIVVDSSAYYLLGYNSSVGSPDGKFHSVDVKVKRRGLQVRHRRGYWALKPEDAARLTAPAKAPVPPNPVDLAMASNVMPRGRIVRTWTGTSRGENGRTRVTFIWEPTNDLPAQDVREALRPTRIAVTAIGDDGTSYYRGVAAVADAGGSRVSFDAPPGHMQLRLSVEGANADVLDGEVRDIVVPDLTAPQVMIGTPELFRARSIPELQRLRTDPAAVPTVSREFRRTDRLLIRVPTYGPGTSTPKVIARLLNRAGQVMTELPMASAAVSDVDLGLGNFPPGEYAIEVVATGEPGEVKAVIGFRVTS